MPLLFVPYVHVIEMVSIHPFVVQPGSSYSYTYCFIPAGALLSGNSASFFWDLSPHPHCLKMSAWPQIVWPSLSPKPSSFAHRDPHILQPQLQLLPAIANPGLSSGLHHGLHHSCYGGPDLI